MKFTLRRAFSIALAISSIFFAQIALPIPSAHSAGRIIGNTVINTLLNGKGAPSSKIGMNGDFYIDTNTYNIYGPKSNGRWPAPISLKGIDGVNGSDGKNGSSLTGSVGPQGPQGATGPQGPQGEPGPKGDKGDTGATGPQGATGLTGATGPAGATGATGATGAKGDTGATGAQGATGSQGPKGDTGLTGAKGDTGTTGVQGPKGDTGTTNIYSGPITFSAALSGNIGNSTTSDSFGNFGAGKSYLVHLTIYGTNSFNLDPIYLKLSASVIGASITPTVTWSKHSSHSYRGDTNKIEQTLTADIVLDGSSTNSGYNLKVMVTTGTALNDASFHLTFTGAFVSTLVGTVTAY